MKDAVSCIVDGMVKDTAISLASPSTLFDAKNIRLTLREESTLLSITNEHTSLSLNQSLSGTFCGYCILNEYLIVFTSTNLYIFTYTNNSISLTKTLNSSVLNISTSVEAFGVIETSDIYKIYWTDDTNYPRMAILLDLISRNTNLTSTEFDFNLPFDSGANVSIVRTSDNNGVFAAGVVLYIFTYYNINGLLTKPFYVSELYPITMDDRGGEPGELCRCGFLITLSSLDDSFKYIRIYRLTRTSLNATPTVEYLPDIICPSSGNSITVYDSGMNGIAITPTDLYYLGGDVFKFHTMAHKDGVLFMGNLEVKDCFIPESLKELIEDGSVSFSSKELYDGEGITTSESTETVVTKRSYRFKILDATNFPNSSSSTNFIDIDSKVLDSSSITLSIGTNSNLNLDTNTTAAVTKKSPLTIAVTLGITGFAAESTPPLLLGVTFDSLNQALRDMNILNKYSFSSTFHIGYTYDSTNIVDKGISSYEIKSIEITLGGSTTLSNSYITLTDGNDVEHTYNAVSITEETSSSSSISTSGTAPSDLVISQLNNTSFFKRGETYRFGVLFRDKYGLWSNVVRIPHSGSNPDWENSTVSPTLILGVFAAAEVPVATINLSGLTIPSDFVAVRPVCVYPEEYERTILAQGILLPTISNKRTEASCYAQPDWFARAFNDPYFDSLVDDGGYIITGKTGGEILSELRDLVSPYSFLVNKEFVTLYSPDIDFATNLNVTNCSLNRVGSLSNLITYNDSFVGISNPASTKTIWNNISSKLGRSTILGYLDDIVLLVGTGEPIIHEGNDIVIKYPIFAWSSLKLSASIPTLSNLNKKYLSNTVNCMNTSFSTPSSLNSLVCKYVNIDNRLLYRLTLDGDPNDIFYNPEIDYLHYPGLDLKFPFKAITYYNNNGNKVVSTYNNLRYLNFRQVGATWVIEADNDLVISGLSVEHGTEGLKFAIADYLNDPTRITYRTSNHVVARLSSNLTGSGSDANFVLAELVQTVNPESRFGGTSDEAVLNNNWLVCGKEVSVTSSTTSVSLDCTVGDTYFQRYECLKTLPLNDSSMNNVVEVVSFMCETHTNLIGRYDKNLFLHSNLYANSSNFNLLNPVYNLLNNYFTYESADYTTLNNLLKFPTAVCWSMVKLLGEKIDTWTNTSLISILDVEGDKGDIIALRRWNDRLLFFLEHGYGSINYNERTSLTTEQGLPVLLANSGKVDGYTYASETIGCLDKLTIRKSHSKLYFVDNSLNEIYSIGGEGASPLSTVAGMKSWLVNNTITKTFFDKNYNDIYFIGSDFCLCYSEILNKFISFYPSYNASDIIDNIEDILIRVTSLDVYKMFTGQGYYIPEITYRINGNKNSYGLDKVFDYIEYRGDILSSDHTAASDTYTFVVSNSNNLNNPFSTIRAYNEYLDSSEVTIDLSLAKKKFRIWRVLIPRVTSYLVGTYESPFRRNRIRNPWFYLTLKGTNKKSVIYDMNVYYTL